jgi:hypothetical protein
MKQTSVASLLNLVLKEFCAAESDTLHRYHETFRT